MPVEGQPSSRCRDHQGEQRGIPQPQLNHHEHQQGEDEVHQGNPVLPEGRERCGEKEQGIDRLLPISEAIAKARAKNGHECGSTCSDTEAVGTGPVEERVRLRVDGPERDEAGKERARGCRPETDAEGKKAQEVTAIREARKNRGSGAQQKGSDTDLDKIERVVEKNDLPKARGDNDAKRERNKSYRDVVLSSAIAGQATEKARNRPLAIHRKLFSGHQCST